MLKRRKSPARRLKVSKRKRSFLQEETAIRKLTIDELLGEQFQDALMALTPREGRVLQLRFGWKDGKSHTFVELGEKFGVSPAEIKKVEIVALDKLRGRLPRRDYDNQEGFLGIAIIQDRIRLVSLSRDGQYSFVDGTEKLHNILYIASAKALAMKIAIEELEALMNNLKATEQAYQDFFERNPTLILNGEYRRAHPQLALTREEGPLIPDFLLEPLDQNSLCDILDLKLPAAKIFVLKQSRMRYSAAVMEACAQLREYNNYFDEKENRDRIFREYGLLAYKPKMIVIIGRKGEVDPILFRKIESDMPQLVLRTYDDVLKRAKAKLEEFK